MSYKLAVIGLGDIRKQDKGITIYLLEKLKKIFSNENHISFIDGGIDGEGLYNSLKKVRSEKVLVLDTMVEVILPGDMDYLSLKSEGSTNIKELLIVSIGILSDDWGRKLSTLISDNLYSLLNRLVDLVQKMAS